ncbi:MAG: DM13 domain-containing protein, partial [Candidatus Pacearchaeota archaeon]|nr:DM13 domain-containing protein [Candidatus Pacearchaeota archaeon]
DVSDIIAEEADLESATTAQGRFVGLASHSGEGTASLVQSGGTTYIRFGDDFRVTNGPDLFVYLGKDGEYAPEARLGALKGNAGAQNYEVPAELDVNEYNEVWVWCRAFFVPFAKAELR